MHSLYFVNSDPKLCMVLLCDLGYTYVLYLFGNVQLQIDVEIIRLFAYFVPT